MSDHKSMKNEPAVLSIIHDLIGVPLFCWVRGSIEGITWSDQPLHPCESNLILRHTLESSIPCDGNPVLMFENEFVFFGLFSLENEIVCIGPVVRVPVTSAYEAQYSSAHGMEQACHLLQCDTGVMTKLLALLVSHYTGRAIRYDEITLRSGDHAMDTWQQAGNWEHYQLSQSEYEREHVSGIDFENRLIEIVRHGDTEAVKKLMLNDLPDAKDMGTVARSQVKQSEYLTVSLLTLLTRAAMEGGMNAERAHELGDLFLMELETASMRGEAFTIIGYRAMYDFTEQVKRAKETKQEQSYIVEACKDYVAKHLRKNLAVSEIAPAIGVSRTHLAHKFKEVVGITVQQYIQKERCRHAANLLQFSDYPISLISEYMCFSSQSYFGSCFRQWYGTTPKEYRMQKQRI